MKMSLKLIIVFSVLAIAVTAVFSLTSFNSSQEQLYESTYTALNAMGSMMQTEIENYIDLMDYALEELTTNVEFMDAFYTVYQYGGDDYSAEADAAQTTMSKIMYQTPLQDVFYRISAFSPAGLFLTSRFEKTNIIVSFSDDARQIFTGLESTGILNRLNANPFRHLILGPHLDAWTTGNSIRVFSVLRSVFWHGEFIGILEVSAELDELNNIFLVLTQEGISTQAIFDDGTVLFRTTEDTVQYPSSYPVKEMSVYKENTSEERWVVRQYSRNLGLNIYVSQQTDALVNTRYELLRNSLLTVLPILAVIILVIILISLHLTSSIRRLHAKIRDLPAEDFLSRTDLAEPTVVVNPGDKELYELEQSFNNMLTSLRTSHANELSFREGALMAKLQALQLQINPHFVYNTLNIISAKGLESGNEEITELCDQFAQMLRYSTDVKSQTATLQQELEHVRTYLFLCKSRYEDQLEFEISVPEELMNIELPRLTLQPLVENAMKFGNRHAGGVCRISITGYVQDGRLSVVVRDNGDGFDWETLNHLRKNFALIEKGAPPVEAPDGGSHVGLLNTCRRLHYYSRGQIHMELNNDNGAVVILTKELKEKQDV